MTIERLAGAAGGCSRVAPGIFQIWAGSFSESCIE